MIVHTITFKAAGVTFENEEGKDIQKEIKKILNEYKKNDYFDTLYGGYTNSEIKEMDLNISEYDGYDFSARLVGDEYKGESCFKIYLKTYSDNYVHIGYSPKENIEEIAEWITKEGITTKGTLKIVGGKYKYCEVYEEDYEEKERVATKELTYGAEITLGFYNSKPNLEFNNITYNENKEYDYINSREETKRQIEREQNIGSIIQTAFWLGFIGLGIFIFVKIISFVNWLFN